MATILHLGVGMWSYGYTDYVSSADGVIEQGWGDSSTFAEAIRELHENVLFMAKDAEMTESAHFDRILEEISLIKDDSGIMDDPDMWEDYTFHDGTGDIEYYVVEV